MKILILLFFVSIILSCTSKTPKYNERIIHKPEEGFKYISRNYPEKELDSIWKYDLKGNIVRIYTGDSLGRCIGWTSGYRQSGELHYIGNCNGKKATGEWHFFNKSGNIDFINFYSLEGYLYQRWFLENSDTSKKLYPKISIEPRTAHVHDTIYVTVDYILDGIDTTGWDYYLFYDFIEREKYETQSSLPYEEYINKYEGKPLESRFEFIVPGEVTMYGYTLAIHRETGDSVYHLDIMEEYLTILDTTSTEL